MSDGGGMRVSQCQKPRGWLGRFVLRRMNASHSRLTTWGLGHLAIVRRDVVLDVGCGGGETVRKLAAAVPEGRVYGVDHSEASVAVATGRTAARSGLAGSRFGTHRSPGCRFQTACSISSRRWKRTSGGLLCRKICAKF